MASASVVLCLGALLSIPWSHLNNNNNDNNNNKVRHVCKEVLSRQWFDMIENSGLSFVIVMLAINEFLSHHHHQHQHLHTAHFFLSFLASSLEIFATNV